MDLLTSQDSSQKAGLPSLIENFSIDGLFGYRSVSLSSKFAATVLIARNGSGKTTLLAALDAFLRGQFSRFVGLQFERITCKLRGHDATLILYRNDVEWLAEFSASGEIGARAKGWELQSLALLELLETDLSDKTYTELIDIPTFHTIYSKSGWDLQRSRTTCERLRQTLDGKNENLDYLRKVLNTVLANIEIVYLPTYRRIELSLPEADSRRGERRQSVLSRLGVARNGLYTADIQFGLGDISDRLRSMYSDMLFLSHQGYGKVSANVINDLISGEYRNEVDGSKVLPSKESLELFFSRIKDSDRNEFRPARYTAMFSIPDLDRVYKGDVPEDAKPFLNYFLDQLDTVIRQTRGTEDLVQTFIDKCNKYLSGQDQSTDKYMSTSSQLIDTKKLEFNRRDLTVKVMSLITENEVPLESLSSGEKQMISLFARLYLYPKQKIVLIDEPELSLSLDWQRQILPDVLRAPTCKQAVAITHSPFIFDNELQPYAGSLRLKVEKISDNLKSAERLIDDQYE